jgi:hypothetical protein
MAAPKKLTVILCLLGCLVWAAGTSVYSVSGWRATAHAISNERDVGYAFCAERYGEPDAKARCVDLFDVQFVNERNTAIATRIIVAILPFGGVGIWVWLMRAPKTRSSRSFEKPSPPDQGPS